MQSFTDNLVATVYWSLGSVVVIASLLVGFGWFTSIRMHERDIAAVRAELTALLSTQVGVTRIELERMFQDKVNTLTNSSATAASQVVGREIAPVLASIERLRGAVSALQNRLAYVEFQSEAWYWEAKGVKSNEFTQYLEILRLAVREKNSTNIATSLKKLTELLKDGAEIFVSTITDVSGIIDSLPTEYAIPAATLREALKAARTY